MLSGTPLDSPRWKEGDWQINIALPVAAIPVSLVLETILDAAVPNHDPQQILVDHPLRQGVDVFCGSRTPATDQDAAARHVYLHVDGQGIQIR